MAWASRCAPSAPLRFAALRVCPARAPGGAGGGGASRRRLAAASRRLGPELLGRRSGAAQQRRGLTDAADAHVAQLAGSGLSEIGRGRGEGGQPWDLSHELELFDFAEDGTCTERVMALADILSQLDLVASTSFLRKVRATQIPKVICERRCIFVTLGDVRALIAHDRALLFGVQRPHVRKHALELSSALSVSCPSRDGAGLSPIPFEMRVLELMLASVTDSHETQLGVLAPVIAAMLRKLEDDDLGGTGVAAHAEREEVLLQRVLPITKTIETFRLDVSETRAALQDALTSEYELAQMQLSWRRDNVRTVPHALLAASHVALLSDRASAEQEDQPSREDAYVLSQMTRRVLATTERELLEIENEIFQLQHSITTTQEVISLNLARSRNRLQTLELFASVAALSFGVGAFGAGILGMNLEDGKNPVFQLEGLFWPTTGALTASCGVVMVGCWIAFRRSANLAGLRAGKGDNVAAFTASLAGHDLSYAFVSHRTCTVTCTVSTDLY